MSKEDMNQFECCYCHSKGICGHLVAAYDQVGHEIIGGLLRDSKEFKEIVSLIFSQLYQTYKERIIDVLSESLLDLWYDSIHEDEGSVYLHNIDPYIFEKLSEILVPVLEDFESGAGSSSAFLMFYSDNPEEIKSELRKTIEMELGELPIRTI